MREKMKNMLLAFVLMSLALYVSSCTMKDETYYVRRGEEIKHQLIVELKGSRNLHELFARQDSLTLLFDELSKMAIEARVFQIKYKKTWEVSIKSLQSSQLLAQELKRVLDIPGAEAFLEKCQVKGFERIDAFEKTRKAYVELEFPLPSVDSHHASALRHRRGRS